MLALNLGCGIRPDGRGLIPAGAEVVQHDRRLHSPHVQVAHDLRATPWPWSAESFDLVLAFDVIEHLVDVLAAMDECWRILKPGGLLIVHTVNVMHGEQAFRDPTHIHFFTIQTFDFFDPDKEWGRNYGRFYTDRHWRLLEARPDGLELLFRLQKRPGGGG